MKGKKKDKERHDRLLALLALARDSRSGTGSCPDPETLALFVEGRLTGSQRDNLLQHLASCQSCYETWLTAAADSEFVPKSANGFRSRKRIFGYLGTAFAAAASVALYLNLQDMADHELVTGRGKDSAVTHAPAPASQAAHEAASPVEQVQAELGSPAPTSQQDKVENVEIQEHHLQRYEPSLQMQDAADSFNKTAVEKGVVPQVAKRKSSSGMSLDEARTSTGVLPPEFLQAVREECSAGITSRDVWQMLYQQGSVYLAGESGGEISEKHGRIIAIMKTMLDSGDIAEGCRLLQGELAEEDKSR